MAADPKPRITGSNIIKPDDVRHFVMDRSVDDNMLQLDLYFSEDEIFHAMRFAAMDFNSIPPLVISVNPEYMPFHMCYLYGIVYHLYLSKLQNLMRNDITYTAGGVQTSLVKDQIAAFKEMVPMYKEEFINRTRSMKQIANINAGFGIF